MFAKPDFLTKRDASALVAGLLTVLLLPAASLAQTCIAPPAGLTGWWPGDGSGQDVYNSHDAILEGGSGYAAGLVGQAFSFDGIDGCARIADTPELDFGGADFTIDFWIYLDDPVGYYAYLAKRDELGNGWSIGTPGFTGAITFELYDGGAGTQYKPGPVFEPGTWANIAAVRKGNTATIWLNGVKSGPFKFKSYRESAAPITIGCQAIWSRDGISNGPNPTPGLIDELQIFKGRALEDAEILAIYAAGANGQCIPPSVCGNGLHQPGEECDDGNTAGADGCEPDCTLSCGNGVLDPVEECDDSNRTSGDGCDENCTVTGCGNGVVTGTEECDDGNTNETDACLSSCVLNACGDGFVYLFHEECDDGNADESDACANDCKNNVCDDGHLYTGVEQCDDGNYDNGDGCDSNCTTTACGNGIRTSGEKCDDGNLTDGDGCESDCTGSPGQLDLSFGTDGIATLPFFGGSDERSGMVLQDDGRIVVATTIDSGGRADFAVARYLDDGSIDAGFGTGGFTVTTIGDHSSARAVAVGADGKIVVVGNSFAGGRYVVTAARYDAAGNLDTGFATAGVFTAAEGGYAASAYAVAIQEDGRVLIAGDDADGHLLLFRLNTNGTRDTTFGSGGLFTNSAGAGYALALQADGMIVVAMTGNSEIGFRVLRVDAAGKLDGAFGKGGIAKVPVEDTESAPALAIQSDGKILLSANSEGAYGSVDFTVARLTADGEMDVDTFGLGDGVATIDFFHNEEFVNAMAVASDGKIVLAGAASRDSYAEIALARLLSDGSPDPTFDHDGILTTAIGEEEDTAKAVAIQPDGRIVVAADSTEPGQRNLVVLRYLAGSCGDRIVQTDQGESCEDGNFDNGDGCESDCTLPLAQATAGAGGTVTTDSGGQGATAAAPVQTAVTTPNGGDVSIDATSGAESSDGLQVVGVTFEIHAPDATVADPLRLELTIDASAIPAGVDPNRLAVSRDGVAMEDCAGAAGVASPDPCVESRTVLPEGDVLVVVLSSHASQWNYSVRSLTAADQKCVNDTNKAAGKVAKLQAKTVAKCLKAAVKDPAVDAQACVDATASGALAKALDKTNTAIEKSCARTPAFAFTSAGDVNAASRQSELDLSADVLGADLSAALLTDSDGAACQSEVLKAAQKMFDTEAKSLIGCVKTALARPMPPVVSAPQLAICFGLAASGSKHDKAAAKITKALDKKCTWVDLIVALSPSCSLADVPGDCLANRTDCRVCQWLSTAAALDADCDFFDDGRYNGSCE